MFRVTLHLAMVSVLTAMACGQGDPPPACDAARAQVPGNFSNCLVLLETDARGPRTSLVLLSSTGRDPAATRVQFAVVTVPHERSARPHVIPAELPEDSFVNWKEAVWNLRVLLATADGALLSAEEEKGNHSLHWWLPWPSEGKGLPRFHRWKAYRFDRRVEKDGSSYYPGINGLRRVVLRVTPEGVPESVQGPLSNAILGRVPVEKHTVWVHRGQYLKTQDEHWHKPAEDSSIRVTSSEGAVCEATRRYGAMFEPEPDASAGNGGLLREWRGRRTPFAPRQVRAEEYRQRRAAAGDPLPNPVTDEQLVAALGPVQAEGARIWFGRAFYDAEGLSGIGGFGYLDCETAEFQEYFPVESVRFMTSALLAEPDAVWLALARFGEYGSSPGGLLRWSREDGSTRRWGDAPLALQVVRDSGNLVLPHGAGLSVLRGGALRHYAMRETPDGALAVVEVRSP